MNKRLFNWIVILMGISLPGIIVIEFILFNNPVMMNNELFGRIIHEALTKAVQEFDINQDIRTIDKNIYDDISDWDEKLYSHPEPKAITGKDSVKKNTGGAAKSQKGKMNQPQFPESVMDIGYQDWNTRRPIDIVRLKAILDESLQQMGIPLDYNYAIFSEDSILQTDIKKGYTPRWYKEKMYSDDIFSRDLYVGICFPGTHVYLSHNSLLRILSITFTFLILLTFILLILLTNRQRKLSLLKTDFINNMTHEFKTPITTIAIATDSIMNDEVRKNEERVDFYTKMIRKENQRMNDQVERILQVARLDRKELFFRFQDVNVHELIEDAIQGILIQIEKRGGRIDRKFDAQIPIITTDPTHFTNMVHNLLDNANKYSPDAPEILVSTENDHKGLYMTVEDKGIGISKKAQAKIFNKFYRLNYGSIDNIKGFGIGLSYVKSILAFNKGKIKVYSEKGKGSRFVVFLPYSFRKGRKF